MRVSLGKMSLENLVFPEIPFSRFFTNSSSESAIAKESISF